MMQLRLDGELSRRLAAESGLSYQDYTVLVVLSATEQGSLRLFELGQKLGWEKSRLSHHVARMVKRGLVTKERCDTDGRGLSAVMTPEGRRELERAAPGHVAAVRQLFVDLLSPEQLDVLAEMAETVLAGLDQVEEDGCADVDQCAETDDEAC